MTGRRVRASCAALMGRLDLRLLCPAVSLYCLSWDETCLRSCGIALLIHMANFELSLLRQSSCYQDLYTSHTHIHRRGSQGSRQEVFEQRGFNTATACRRRL